MATTFNAGPDAGTPVAGTLSVAGPLPRMDQTRRTEIAAALAVAARAMAAIWPLRRRQIGALPRVSTEVAPCVLPTETST